MWKGEIVMSGFKVWGNIEKSSVISAGHKSRGSLAGIKIDVKRVDRT